MLQSLQLTMGRIRVWWLIDTMSFQLEYGKGGSNSVCTYEAFFLYGHCDFWRNWNFIDFIGTDVAVSQQFCMRRSCGQRLWERDWNAVRKDRRLNWSKTKNKMDTNNQNQNATTQKQAMIYICGGKGIFRNVMIILIFVL